MATAIVMAVCCFLSSSSSSINSNQVVERKRVRVEFQGLDLWFLVHMVGGS